MVAVGLWRFETKIPVVGVSDVLGYFYWSYDYGNGNGRSGEVWSGSAFGER